MFSNFRQCYQVMKDHSKITNIHFEWPKRPKKRFLALLLSLVCWIDLILHIVLVLNVFQLSAMLPALEGSFEKHKNGFLNDPKSQKRSFWPFSGVLSTGLKVKKSRTQKVRKSRSRQVGQAEKWRSREVKEFERREVQGFLTLSHLPRGKATVLNVSWG